MNSQSKGKPQIGVLDADFAILGYIHRILSDRFTVSLFTEAEELTQKVKSCAKLDLLLMDWQMDEADSGENALKFLAQIRSLRPSLPIVLLTCSADLQDVVQATRIGATEVVLKPFRKPDIDFVGGQNRGGSSHQFLGLPQGVGRGRQRAFQLAGQDRGRADGLDGPIDMLRRQPVVAPKATEIRLSPAASIRITLMPE